MPPPAADLLAWYDRNRRAMPWRALPGRAADPYHVWLSEIMLQQTGVATVIPYFGRFLERFPTLQALADASEAAVLAAWAGLGYYARARNVHACARLAAAAGGFPGSIAGLRALPGIGDYTAVAIGAIAFGLPGVPVDGNVERVVSRLYAVKTPLPAAKSALRARAAELGTDAQAIARPSDFAQALFDLGATVCTPKAPACVLCPWRAPCRALAAGIADRLPARAPKAAKPERFGIVFHLADPAGALLLRTRPSAGLLGGMAELPGTPWTGTPWAVADAIAGHAPMAGLDWREAGEVRHVFTHFALRLTVLRAESGAIDAAGRLVAADALAGEALPTLFRKCLALARPQHPPQHARDGGDAHHARRPQPDEPREPAPRALALNGNAHPAAPSRETPSS